MMMTEMRWQVNEEVSRDMSGDADGMNQGVVPETRWCISKWAICDFQGQNGWRARKSDNRWGASTARAVKRDQVLKIARLPACMNFEVRERRIYIQGIHWSRDLRMGVIGPMWWFRSLNNSTSKRVLYLLEPVKLTVWKAVIERITVVKFRMD